jgi:hypothetical protein
VGGAKRSLRKWDSMGEVEVEPFNFLTGWCVCTASSVGSFRFILKSPNGEQDLMFSRMTGSQCIFPQNFRSNTSHVRSCSEAKRVIHSPTGLRRTNGRRVAGRKFCHEILARLFRVVFSINVYFIVFLRSINYAAIRDGSRY